MNAEIARGPGFEFWKGSFTVLYQGESKIYTKVRRFRKMEWGGGGALALPGLLDGLTMEPVTVSKPGEGEVAVADGAGAASPTAEGGQDLDKEENENTVDLQALTTDDAGSGLSSSEGGDDKDDCAPPLEKLADQGEEEDTCGVGEKNRKEKERKSVLLSFYILILRYHTLLELSLHSETIPPL